jgi:hypothetical protein
MRAALARGDPRHLHFLSTVDWEQRAALYDALSDVQGAGEVRNLMRAALARGDPRLETFFAADSWNEQLLAYNGLADVKGSGAVRALMRNALMSCHPVLETMECQKDWLGKLRFVAAQERGGVVPPAVVERMKKLLHLPSPSEHWVVMKQVRRERGLSFSSESTTYDEYSAYRLWTGAYLPEGADIDGARSESEKVAQRAAYQRKYFPTFRHPGRFRAEGGAPREGEEQARLDALKRWAEGGQGLDEESADDEC